LLRGDGAMNLTLVSHRGRGGLGFLFQNLYYRRLGRLTLNSKLVLVLTTILPGWGFERRGARVDQS